jgi:hypothetical protein
LGRLEPQAAGRDDDAGVHADTLVEYVPLADHAAGARGSINRLGCILPDRCCYGPASLWGRTGDPEVLDTLFWWGTDE